MHKKIFPFHIFIFVSVAFLLTGCSLPWQKDIQKQVPVTEEATVQMVMLKITPAADKTYEYPLTYQANLNVLDLFQLAGVPIEVKKYDIGSFVESVSSIKGEKGKYWIYYVNGTTGIEAADKYLVKPGDTIEWKYEEEKEGL
ncbi:MAG: DUF4430 domain-containing protein [Patescibacteria group bacterium]